MANQNNKMSLAKKMAVSLVCGLVAGIAMLVLRENLTADGGEATWAVINNLLFADITAAGNESALGIFYLVGQMFVRALQLVIVPMVFTSITLAIGKITDTKKLGRISAKTIGGFLTCSFFALLLACVVGHLAYSAGFFALAETGLEGAAGKSGSNPLGVVLNAVPSNIVSTFSSNSAVLAIVFIAVALGLSMNHLGEERTATLKKLLQEINDVVVVFLNYVVTKFSPVAVFMLLTRTFASYGINHLRPALAYVVLTVILLLVFLFIAYPMFVAITAKVSPFKFAQKITKVAIFGFSTSSSAATLPLNIKTTTEELGVDDTIASFVLPLGMTVNMNGTAIMQVVATLFIAGCAGYEVTFMQLVVIAMLALIASAGT
ncbi:MAG: dicarboxylate/amino acid:cation symporter, partial [Lachnospiraceae bacterium]|nr:dicarboxylate/amino acid:cation symporter [Lachnospiraceae bacterium]